MPVVSVLGRIGDALGTAGAMTWEILWPPILGFGLSAIVELSSAVGPSTACSAMNAHHLAIAGGLGAASSSCSYAAGGG